MPLFSVSITLVNDSNYKLNAQIIDGTGRHLALIHLVPGQMYIYSVTQGPFEPNTNSTYTPLTVIFLCEAATPYNYSPSHKKKDKNLVPSKNSYVEQFGIWTGVPTGALVNALGCPSGTKSCISTRNPNIKVKRTSSESVSQGSNNWSNDGGQSWTNNAGAAWFNCPQGSEDCQRNPHVKSTPTSNPDDITNYGQETIQNTQGEQWVTKPDTKNPVDQQQEDEDKDDKDDDSKSSKEENIDKSTPLPFFER